MDSRYSMLLSSPLDPLLCKATLLIVTCILIYNFHVIVSTITSFVLHLVQPVLFFRPSGLYLSCLLKRCSDYSGERFKSIREQAHQLMVRPVGSSILWTFYNCYLGVCSYLSSNQESIMAFYQDLRNSINSIPNVDKILLLGDFNARVGSDHENWNALGQRGTGKMNE